MKSSISLLPMLMWILLLPPARAQLPVAYWSFDGTVQSLDKDSTHGIVSFRRGISGNAMVFDGYSSEVIRKNRTADILKDDFTISAWIAPQEYSWNISALVNQQKNFSSGFLFGINHLGKLVAGITIDHQWRTLVSADSIPLLHWSFVAMKFEKDKGISFFINGRLAGFTALPGTPEYAPNVPLLIGKTQAPMAPAFTERKSSLEINSWMRYDGLMDELKIFDRGLSEKELQASFAAVKLTDSIPLQFRKMPSGPDTPMPFGAYYTCLSYSPGWDALWCGSEFPDLVVRFSNCPAKLVFWRGTGYIPALVSENGIWMTDQSMENFGTGECYEAMGDKQCRYSHIRLLENSPVRVVVHWRHALAGIKHQILHENINVHGDWADEYWTVYPDGVAVRKQVLWTGFWSTEARVYQFQETIFFNQPGTRPQDNVEYQAITFSDMKGNKASYSWEKGAPAAFDKTKYQAVQLVNFKSNWKPYGIFEPERIVFPFNFGWVKGYSTFPCWNHWPVSQIASDGRNAIAPDKPSHSSLTQVNGDFQLVERGPNNNIMTRSLVGMTNLPIDSLLPLARSWNFPAQVRLAGSANTFRGYDKYQRSYIFTCASEATQTLDFVLEAGRDSPLFNLSILLENWNKPEASLLVNGVEKQLNKDYFICYQPALEGNRLFVWLFIKAEESTRIELR